MNDAVTTLADRVTAGWDDMVARLSVLDDSDWVRPTGLRGWTVADLAAHAAWGASMEAVALERAVVGDVELATGTELDATATVSSRLDTLVAARHDLASAIGRTVELCADTPVPLAAGVFPLGLVRSILVMEAGVHADDLRLALGVDQDLDPVVVAAATAFFASFVPVLGSLGVAAPAPGTTVHVRGDSVDLAMAVGQDGWEVVESPAGRGAGPRPGTVLVTADDTTCVRLLYGRPDPRADTRRVEGDAAVADLLKTWIPGP